MCEVYNPLDLWNKQWRLLSDDIAWQQNRSLEDNDLQLSEEEIKNLTLYEIERILDHDNKSLKHFKLPSPDLEFRTNLENILIRDEMIYDWESLPNESSNMYNLLNVEQNKIFDVVIDAVQTRIGGMFFVYGSGGTGKTFLCTAILEKLQSQKRTVLVVASSVIASLLLPGGRTAHSRFKIPLTPDETSSCYITKNKDLEKLIQKAELIIWDEAPMVHRNALEAVDTTLKDLMDDDEKIFGGKTILLGGDFRQVLPVIRGGTRADIVSASINRSHLWSDCQVFKLTTNMRIRNKNADRVELPKIKEFGKWVLHLGDGKLPITSMKQGEDPTWIKIPNDLLIQPLHDPIQQIVNNMFPNMQQRLEDVNYLKSRCILAPNNECVDEVNSYIVSTIQSKTRTYYSVDSISPTSEAIENKDDLFPVELLNSLKISGFPNHELELRVGVPIMLLRNYNQSMGLCNGTRLIVTKLAAWVIEAKMITGNNIGRKVLIHRIIMETTDTK
ncbi:hypothetical protein MKX03_034312 [Papaver bracteatum]|nr:hypothetical protein MKX03_034312 [Papaver bracteatum]